MCDSKVYVSDTELIKEWDFNRNNEDPSRLSSGSGKRGWWLCSNKHSWVAPVSRRFKGHGCPFCSGNAVCSDNCLSSTHEYIASEWNHIRNAGLSPDMVTYGSTKRVWWVCSKGHEWCCKINDRTSGKGHGCPYCSGKLVCSDNCLLKLRPGVVVEWDWVKNGCLTPNDVTVGSTKKVWWVCSSCNYEWKTQVCVRTGGHGCPRCAVGPVSKKSQQWLNSLGIPQENREILLSELNYRVDAFVPETNTVYEFFGDYWHGNPEIFSPAEKNKTVNKTFGELYKETEKRLYRLIQAGYEVVYVWENEVAPRITNT